MTMSRSGCIGLRFRGLGLSIGFSGLMVFMGGFWGLEGGGLRLELRYYGGLVGWL